MHKQKGQLAQDRSAFRKGAGLEFVEIKVELNCLGSGKRLADISQPQNTKSFQSFGMDLFSYLTATR